MVSYSFLKVSKREDCIAVALSNFVQVDGQVNPKLQSVHIQRFPITTAHFSLDGEEVIMAGQRKNFFVYNMLAGKITQIHGIRGRENSR